MTVVGCDSTTSRQMDYGWLVQHQRPLRTHLAASIHIDRTGVEELPPASYNR